MSDGRKPAASHVPCNMWSYLIGDKTDPKINCRDEKNLVSKTT